MLESALIYNYNEEAFQQAAEMAAMLERYP